MCQHYELITSHAVDGYYHGVCKLCGNVRKYPERLSDHFTRGAVTKELNEVERVTQEIESSFLRGRYTGGWG